MSKEKPAPIKTQEDMNRVIAQERGKHYIVCEGNVFVVNKKMLFDKERAEYYFYQLAREAGSSYEHASDAERKEIQDFLISLMILPLRVH